MRPLLSASRALLCIVVLVALPAAFAGAAAPHTTAALSTQLRHAASDPFLSPDQRAFYAARLASLESGRATRASVEVNAGGAWSVYAQSPRRGNPMVVHDVANDRLILFGGVTPDGLASDVWTVALSGDRVWRQIQTAGPAPAARLGAAVTFDPDQQRLLVYGGSDVDGAYLDDLWSLSLNGPAVWTLLTPSGDVPGARANATGVQDTLHHRMVVIGGSDGSFSPPSSVWTLPFVANPDWAELPTTGTPPSLPGVAFYDPLKNAALMFVQTADFPYTVAFYKFGLDSPYAWSLIPSGCCGPSGSSQQPAAFNPVTRTFITWGSGTPGSCYRTQLNSGSPTWEYLYNNPVGPYPHVRQTLLFDAKRNRTMLVGGATGPSTFEADVWSAGADPMTWTAEIIPLTRRSGHAVALDESRHQLYQFGGGCDTTANNTIDRLTNGLWRMTLGDTAVWRRLPSHGGPLLGRAEASLVRDTKRDRLVLFGGQRVGTMTNEVWTYSLLDTSGWQRLVIGGTLPRQRASQGAVYDSLGDRMIVFGGVDAGTILGDLWALDFTPSPHWEHLFPAGAPPDPRAGSGMVFDPDSSRVLMAAGSDAYYSLYNLADELWSLYLTPTLRWRRLIGPGTYSPTPSVPMALLTYDAIHHLALLTQGYSTFSYGDTSETRVRLTQPGRDSVWAPIQTLGLKIPYFNRPVGAFDPATSWLIVQGDGEGDSYSTSDERTFALTLLSTVLDVPPVIVDRRTTTLEVYPNPSHGMLRVRWSMPSAGPAEIEVFDVTGRRVAAERVIAGPGSREVTVTGTKGPFPVGLYLVRARLGAVLATRRVVVLQ